MEIVLSINDFECIYLSNFEKLVDRVRIVDTLGIITHYEIEEVFDLIQDSTTFDLPVEYQFRNDASSAVYNSYTALSNGCSYIALSVLGIGKKNGITDLSGFISRIYANDKQLLKRYDLSILKHLDEFVAKRLGIHIPINNPITGICSWEQNIVYDEDFNTNIIFTQDINLFKKIMQHIMPNVYEKLTDDYIRKLYIQINDDTSKDTTLYIKLNSDIDYARDYICKYIS
jgi:isopropylmalate/homocitrate/citramalate synthase